jgi:hypothetical protein
VYWMGSLPVVAVNDYKLIAETFQRDAESYAGRLQTKEFDEMVRSGQHGMIFVDGKLLVQ